MKKLMAFLVASAVAFGTATVSAQVVIGKIGLSLVIESIREYASQLGSMLSGFQTAFGNQIDQT